ncbi:hypothetical protein [Pedobacter sp. AJM]|uniref:hypothetical protein n=1 Tax=Pedobacter sp. AJM TaxID=2003629 RepID=UPI000B4C1266|nr:hypothetical protein [Pedobacter sp. AJM]OWK71761.1 hypothetical protein CBW18_04635 [Pedobacter sp. AJM]
MEVIYLLSDVIDYDKLICDDAGPGYSRNMGWRPVYLKDMDLPISGKQSIVVVDNRVQTTDIEKINYLIENNPTSIFFLKIVDPYYENCNGHCYYSFLEHASRNRNAFLLSVYEPKEITLDLKEKFSDRFLHLPYPYLSSKEVDINTSKKKKIIISGALNENVYPYRYSIWKKVTRTFFRFLFKILKHPGYLDLNREYYFKHPFVKDSYIQYISKYKYMLLCPSRCEIELLKYNECMYAGALPVGLPPTSYPTEIQALFLKLDSYSFNRDLIKIFFSRQNSLIVNRLRRFLHETRNPKILNNNLLNFVSKYHYLNPKDECI